MQKPKCGAFIPRNEARMACHVYDGHQLDHLNEAEWELRKLQMRFKGLQLLHVHEDDGCSLCGPGWPCLSATYLFDEAEANA